MGNKYVFWQALIVALLIFWTGIIIGVFFEGYRANKLESVFFNAETEIFDIQTKNEILRMFNFECKVAFKENIDFADKIFLEARELEKYETSERITSDLLNLHSRYDLLRVMLWKNVIELQKNCNSSNIIVYLYQYDTSDIDEQAKQIAFSKVLTDLKKQEGDRVILIPIATDTTVSSLNLLMKKYELEKTPVIFINQKHKITGLPTLEELEQYLE